MSGEVADAIVPFGPRTETSWLAGLGRRTRTLFVLWVQGQFDDIPSMARQFPVALEELATGTRPQRTLHLSFVIDNSLYRVRETFLLVTEVVQGDVGIDPWLYRHVLVDRGDQRS